MTSLQQLLLIFSLLSASSEADVVYSCSNAPTPETITPSTNRFSLRLNFTSSPNTGKFCHVQLRQGSASGKYFYVQRNSSMASQKSKLTLSSDYGPSGVPIAWVTYDNQSYYHAFASPSTSLYVQFGSSLYFLSDSIELNVELVSLCPSGWHQMGGTCFGPTSPGQKAWSFYRSVVGCHNVRANLAMNFSSASQLMKVLNATGLSVAWVGVADSPSGVNFLNGQEFFINSSSIDFQYATEPSNCQERSCRCIAVSDNNFYRRYCQNYIPYLCSSQVGGDDTFYSLESLNGAADTAKNNGWLIGMLVGGGIISCLFCLGIFIYMKFLHDRQRRSVGVVGGGGDGGGSAVTASSSTPTPNPRRQAPPKPNSQPRRPPGQQPPGQQPPGQQPPGQQHHDSATFYQPDIAGASGLSLVPTAPPPTYGEAMGDSDKPPPYEPAASGK